MAERFSQEVTPVCRSFKTIGNWNYLEKIGQVVNMVPGES